MFSNKSTDGVFVMPKDVLKYASGAKKSELKLIMYLFANMNNFSPEKAAEDLSETVESINSAIAFWRGAGIVSECDGAVTLNSTAPNVKSVNAVPKNLQTEETRVYSAREIAEARETDKEFSQVVEFVQSVVGNLLNSTKASSLLYLYRNLGMQSDVIIGIAAHCQSEGKNKLQYIVGTAESIHNDGVVTYKELESYLARKREYAEFESKVKRIIGAGDRAFTPSEKKFVSAWENDYKISSELVELAYERTISLISKPSLPYMAKIIENWVNEGVADPVKAREYIEAQNLKKKAEKNTEGASKAKKAGFDIDLEDIFEKP